MEYTKNVDVIVILDEIRYAVVSVQQYSDLAGRGLIPVSDFGVIQEYLRAFIYPCHNIPSGPGVILGNVLEDIFKPFLRLEGPVYFGHDRIRRPISSFEMVRPASESANPRWIIT